MANDVPRRAEVVIVGGGVMGVSTAYHLCKKGVTDVVLLEREQFLGSMSTGQCAGGIRHQFASETNIRLSIESIEMLERFPQELDQDIGLHFDGYLFLLTTEEDVAAFEGAVDLQHSLGIDTQWLTPEEVSRRVPQLDTHDVIAATFYGRDGLCDPSGVVQGYASGARRLGARVLTDVEARSLRSDGTGLVVETDSGPIEGRIVVNACGAWASQLAETIGVEIPIEPIRRQVVVTTPLPEVPNDFPFTIFFGSSLYFHREAGGILTGKSNPNETPGFKLEVDPAWEEEHLSEAMERMPLLENAGVQSRWAGLYEVTPDAHPIFGPVAEVDGLYVMAGFSGHGFMHGPMAGLLMAEEIVDGNAHTLDVSGFAFERFVTGDLHPEYNVI